MIPATTTARSLTTNLTTCGLTVPAKAAHWLELAQKIQDDLDSRATEDLHAEVETLTAGTVAATVDRLTRERLEADERRRVALQMVETAAGNAVRVIRGDADAIITKARKGFDAAARTLTGHADKYAPGEPAVSVLDRGADVAAAWTGIREASAQLDGYARLWADLYGITASADAFLATYKADHWERVDAQAGYDSGERWHTLAVTGLPMRLNTYTEAVALADQTPVKELRAEQTLENGFRGVAQVRQDNAGHAHGHAIVGGF